MTKRQPTQKKHHIKKDDIVEVIAGNDRKKRGKVLNINTKSHRAIVENINVRTFHRKPTQNRPAGREKKEASIHLSNLMLIDPNTQEKTRTGRRHNEQNKLQRYSKKTNQLI